MTKHSAKDGIVAMPRGEARLTLAREGMVVEMQDNGIFNGFEPSDNEVYAEYHRARSHGKIVGFDAILSDFENRTTDYHDALVIEGLTDLKNDPLFDELKTGYFALLAVVHRSNRHIGRTNVSD